MSEIEARLREDLITFYEARAECCDVDQQAFNDYCTLISYIEQTLQEVPR